MVLASMEPVCAGIMVALINKYLLNNLGGLWHSCSAEEIIVDEHETEEESVSSTNTTIIDADFICIVINSTLQQPISKGILQAKKQSATAFYSIDLNTHPNAINSDKKNDNLNRYIRLEICK
jgi:hypothetical protein